MLSSSSSSSSSSLGQPVSEKLSQDNFLLWKAQVVPIVRGAQLFGYLDGTEKEPASFIYVTKDGKTEKVPNPAHAPWAAQDQQVVGFINASLSREVLGQVAMCTTAAEAWVALNAMFSSQSRARMIQLCGHLATTCKGNLSATAYYNKMKGFADELAAAGKPLSDEDFVSYIVTGLDQEYNSFVENMCARSDPISAWRFVCPIPGC